MIDSWNCPSSFARMGSSHPKTLTSSPRNTRVLTRTRCEVYQRGITLFDDSTSRVPESATATQEPEQMLSSSPEEQVPQAESTPPPSAVEAEEPKSAASPDDFAAALENFTTESE
jgi:hypothetical protein